MKDIKEYLSVVVSQDRMSAEIDCEKYPDQMFSEEAIYKLLKDFKVINGIDQEVVESMVQNKYSLEDFPITIAKGEPPTDGQDGSITYEFNYSSEVDRGPDWNFRDIMQIPSVKANQKLATITLPTEGNDGMNVLGRTLYAKPGKPVPTKAGANVLFKEEDLSFYSTIEGQVSFNERSIKVLPLYEVNETLSMKTGNLDFIGSIVIKGDVPTGYTVKAKGDIKVFGIVEAATIIAGGSVYVSEGLAGLQKGIIKAEEDIHIGYINQGIIQSKNSIFVENSIIHSEVIANNQICCQKGNIIGGSLSAGKLIEASDIGNRLSTETKINLGVDRSIDEEISRLQTTKEELTSTLQKLTTLGEKLKNTKHTEQTKVTLLRQRNSQLKIIDQIKEINDKLQQMNSFLGSEKEARLIVKNNIYPNVVIAFGKYKHKIDRLYNFITIKLDQHEIVIRKLEK